MDKVLINNKYYDPYFILSVTPDDSIKHITKAFRIKAKVLHPDKFKNKPDANMDKVYKHFHILLECYEFILNKHKNLHLEKETEFIEPTQQNSHQDLENTHTLDHGYGDLERLKTLEEYDEKRPSQTKIINGKFNKKQFNRIFEYNESQHSDSEPEKQTFSLIHKTTDGFSAYNSNDLKNCSLVKSFNGLMILGDDLGQSGKGYTNDKCADYKQSFSGPVNPDKPIKIPKTFKTKDQYTFESKTIKSIIKERSDKTNYPTESFATQEQLLLSKKKKQLKEKIKEDEDFIKKYGSSVFSKRLIENASSRKLKTSTDYLSEIDDQLSFEENIRKHNNN